MWISFGFGSNLFNESLTEFLILLGALNKNENILIVAKPINATKNTPIKINNNSFTLLRYKKSYIK